MKYTRHILSVLLLIVFMIQCDLMSNDKLLNTPNAPSPDNLNVDFLLNTIELKTAVFFSDIKAEPSELTRLTHMAAATYANAYQPENFDDNWNDAYSDILININKLVPIVHDRELYFHEGMGRVLKAYVLFNLVDLFGEVPLSEAFNPDNFNSKVDDGRSVYAAAFAELDTARSVLNMEEVQKPGSDLYYGGNKSNWTTLANTLELKALYQQSNIDDPVLPEGVTNYKNRINSLLNGDIIDTPSESFVFRYGNNPKNPDTRSPAFTDNYLTTANTYMSNSFMNELLQSKEIPDPRLRYYIYRQVDKPTDQVNNMRCINNPPPAHYQGNGNGKGLNDPWCQKWNSVGYWGRDHGVALSDPGNGLLRSTYGPYPAGGRFDANQAESINLNQGLRGAGIQPIWMNFFTDFIRAEVELRFNDNTDAAFNSLMSGIQNSFDYVLDFGSPAVTAEGGTASSFADAAKNNEEDYLNAVTDRWNNQVSGDQDRLSIILKEYWLALFGNGVEAYNQYRLIAPAKENPFFNMQPNDTPNPGQFYNTLKYPSVFIERNSNAEQRDRTEGPFWFTADPGFANF